MKRNLLILLLVISGAALAKPADTRIRDAKHVALSQCLDENYRRVNPDITPEMMDDRSYLIERYALDNAGVYEKLQKFVTRETRDGHKLTLSLKNPREHTNDVLANCMAFYESPRLDAFVRSLF